jgi:hypothetical protein
MIFTVSVAKVEPAWDIQPGDTVRRRDLHTPFFDLDVSIAGQDRDRLPNLKKILLYSFDEVAASIWDEFDGTEFLRKSRFKRLAAGSVLKINGPVHPILSGHSSERFGSYQYVIVQPQKHAWYQDVNRELNTGITEWLVEEKAVLDTDRIQAQSRLVVAWECAHVVLPPVAPLKKDLDV